MSKYSDWLDSLKVGDWVVVVRYKPDDKHTVQDERDFALVENIEGQSVFVNGREYVRGSFHDGSRLHSTVEWPKDYEVRGILCYLLETALSQYEVIGTNYELMELLKVLGTKVNLEESWRYDVLKQLKITKPEEGEQDS